MTRDEFERRLDKAISKRIRLVAENPHGQFSSTWMFWGNRNDFYFAAKSISGALKVSLHENGRGYVGYSKPYFVRKLAEGIAIPAKTTHEWALPKPGPVGAVHAASLKLPANYCRAAPLSDSARKNTFVLGIDDGSCVDIGVFLSHEHPKTLEAKLEVIGKPMFVVTLDNNMHISLVARSQPFDPTSTLPPEEAVARGKSLLLNANPPPDTDDLNAMLWNDPGDGGTLQVTDVGGVRLKRRPTV
ncbi:hypothetical protein [Bradyrhizobium sp. AUGA SZCCT0042]|uniref:hypothetical protein n=1 Tax=Bradyrhizobium sp. AUGA SZCCT0042 TaxID=2807651 RepID=UPI001BA7031A|nr:hypothetical protein [Bradyrhizobium sp. AUGA SZCCT0042]MBR1298541.1 hypothetical protein [Bradyrhizobium sp. AUGA SZCCT0042]